MHATIALQQWLGGHVFRLVGMTAVCLVYFAALPVIFAVISPFIVNGRGHVEGARALLGKRPLLRKYAGTVMAIMLFFLIALWFFLFVQPAISIPSAIGEAVGTDVAKLDLRDFDRGCGHSVATCYQAIRNGKEIGRGYVIAQSPDRVAVYYMGNTSQFPLGDVMLRTPTQRRHKVLRNRRDGYLRRNVRDNVRCAPRRAQYLSGRAGKPNW